MDPFLESEHTSLLSWAWGTGYGFDHMIAIILISGPTPQVASSAAHMYICSSKLHDVVWVRVFGIDSSNSLPDYAILAV